MDAVTNVPTVQADALETLTRGEIDMQIQTAKRYPRSLSQFTRDALSLATYDQRTAEGCFYAIPRDGKMIEGPSVRLAEICASSWGNLRFGARIIEIGHDHLTAQGFAHDLQTNIAVSIEVRRRIVTKQGRRFSSDMINVTANAAAAIAFRNALFRVIPQSAFATVYDQVRQVARGDAKTLQTRIQKALAHFTRHGIETARILAVLHRRTIEDLTVTDLETLQGLRTAIADGEITADDAFRDDTVDPVAPQTGTAAVKAMVHERPAPQITQPITQPTNDQTTKGDPA